MPPSADQPFSQLELSSAQIQNLDRLGYQAMTPIQAQSLPLILQGRDVIAQAQTGSGKTCAFGLGLLKSIDTQQKKVQGLVICPTRELAEQVTQELRRLARATANLKCVALCGGQPIGPQKASLQHGAHIVVGTPGRLLDHLSRGSLKLSQLKTLVYDEADRMLDMGFLPDVATITSYAPTRRQTLLFSATYPPEIQQISRELQHNPALVEVAQEADDRTVEELFYEVQSHDRNKTLLALFEHYQLPAALVFCHTKVQCNQVAQFLNGNKIHARALHGDFEQRERQQILTQFTNASCPVLVATDVAARGLDIKSLPAVINYELPRDPEVYVHRIGRTARAGAQGLAFSLFTQAEQIRVRAIEDYLQQPCLCDVYDSLDRDSDYQLSAPMRTLEINLGRKNKIRAGDILGALTGDGGLAGSQIGKINIGEMNCYIAVEKNAVKAALTFFEEGRVKTKRVRARLVGTA